MADTAKGRYLKLAETRRPFLDRARDAARLTIPSLLPPEGHNHTSQLPEPNQSLGSRLVVHLASYFTSALLPPGRNLFRLGATPEALLAAGRTSLDEDAEQLMSMVERIPHNEIARRAWRSPTTVSIQHLLVAGNVLERLLPDNSIVVYPLDRFVVVRDPSGRLTEFLIEEPLDPATLPEELAAIAPASAAATPGASRIPLYTWGRLTGGQWKVHQELDDVRVPNSEGSYDPSVLPYFAIRWSAIAGEDYGRGKVEEHLADLRTFDGLSKSMRDGSAMASRNITMIRPNAAAGANLRRKLAQANNGEFVVGNPEDVSMLQFQNVNGLQVVQVELETLRRELGAAFMLTSTVTRNAERVTAEEVRRVTQELDSVQGGAYSMLSQEMLRPRIDRLLFQMRAAGQLPDWPEGTVEPTILTGLEALGREADTTNVMQGLQMLQGYPPEVYQDYIKWPVLLKRGFAGFDLSDAINTEAEAEAIRQTRNQAAMEQQALAAAAGPVAQAAAQAATQ